MRIDFGFDKSFDRLIKRVAKEFGSEFLDVEGIGKQLDLKSYSKEFFASQRATADVSVDSNANVTDRSVIAYQMEMKKPYEKLNSLYQLWKKIKKEYSLVKANEIIRQQIIGDLYVNDLHGVGAGMPYCFNYSTYDIMVKGLPMIDKIKSLPPKHLLAFRSQVEQFVTLASNSTLGATGLADLILVMSFYVEDILDDLQDSHFRLAGREDVLAYVKETLASMVYTLNQPMRANQSPFTNISLYDDVFLEKLKGDYIHPEKGTPLNIEVVKLLQDIYIDVMNEELERTPITFPVTSFCLAVKGNEIIDQNTLFHIMDKNKKFGFMNIYLGDSSTLSSCCRLRSEMKTEYFNSFGAGGSKIGSLGVCTVNLPRLAYKFAGCETVIFEKELAKLCTNAFIVNHCKKLIVQDKIDRGFHPLYDEGFLDIDKQYLTLGFNGFNEMLEIFGIDPVSEEGVCVGKRVLSIMRDTNDKLGKKCGVPVNMEQIPAENTSIKFAKKDMMLGYNKGEYPMYSNQFIPLVNQADILDRIRLQGEYDSFCSGGSILHLNVGEKVEDTAKLVNLMNTCAKNGVIYVAINYNFQECEHGHMSVGKTGVCNVCGGKIISNYTRVVGFLTKVDDWHKVRRNVDYPNRKFYSDLE